MELVDNPIDYRRGRKLNVRIQIDKPADTVRVVDWGGGGMTDEGLRGWIGWGIGPQHEAGDIGQYHVGGKLAAIYIGEKLEITSRGAGEDAIWRFVDPHWGSRVRPFEGRLERLAASDLVDSFLQDLPRGTGFTDVRITGLKPHRYEPARLLSQISNTYRLLLDAGDCIISINEASVVPAEIAVSATFSPVVLQSLRLPGGATVDGKIWVTDRDQMGGAGLPAGVRTVFNGRLITEGEEFGHYLAGRGPLQRLMGEIQIHHMRPNTSKTGWDQDSPDWADLQEMMHCEMKPVVGFLRTLADARPVSRSQRKRAQRVRRKLTAAFRRLAADGVSGLSGLSGEGDAPAGRRRPEAITGHTHCSFRNDQGRRAVENRTPPPKDAVGTLVRRFRGGFPRIDFDALGRSPRAQWRDDGTQKLVIINTDHPMYRELGETDAFILEVACLLLLEEGEELALSSAMTDLDRIVWTVYDFGTENC